MTGTSAKAPSSGWKKALLQVLDLLLSETKIVSKTRPTSRKTKPPSNKKIHPKTNPKNTVLSISSSVQKGRKDLYFFHDFFGVFFHTFRWQVLISESPLKNLWHSSLRIRILLNNPPSPTRTPFLSDTALTIKAPQLFIGFHGHEAIDQLIEVSVDVPGP